MNDDSSPRPRNLLRVLTLLPICIFLFGYTDCFSTATGGSATPGVRS